jgi:hypothetical protein
MLEYATSGAYSTAGVSSAGGAGVSVASAIDITPKREPKSITTERISAKFFFIVQNPFYNNILLRHHYSTDLPKSQSKSPLMAQILFFA